MKGGTCQVYDAVQATPVLKLLRPELRPVIRDNCLWTTPRGEENVERQSGGVSSRVIWHTNDAGPL